MYQFSSNPRAVRTRQKTLFRPEEDEKCILRYENVMFDPRVVRGNTYAGAALNKGGEEKLRPKRKKMQSSNKQNNAIKALYSRNREPKVHREPVDISANLVEQVEPVDRQSAETQTNKFMKRPETPPYIPCKRGVDQGTQIEDKDNLFDFDKEVEPILKVIVSKTLEQSLMEVIEEEEIKYLKERREDFEEEKRREKRREIYLQEEERKRFKKKNEKVAKEKKRLENELVVCRKVASRSFFRSYIGSRLEEASFKHLAEVGHFRDKYRDAVTNDFMPWLLNEVSDKIQSREYADLLAHELVTYALQRRRELASERSILHLNSQTIDEKISNIPEFEEKTEKLIKILLQGEEFFGEDTVGPITLSRSDTIQQAEHKIHLWIIDNVDTDFDSPEGGYLSLAVGGNVSNADQTPETLLSEIFPEEPSDSDEQVDEA